MGNWLYRRRLIFLLVFCCAMVYFKNKIEFLYHGTYRSGHHQINIHNKATINVHKIDPELDIFDYKTTSKVQQFSKKIPEYSAIVSDTIDSDELPNDLVKLPEPTLPMAPETEPPTSAVFDIDTSELEDDKKDFASNTKSESEGNTNLEIETPRIQFIHSTPKVLSTLNLIMTNKITEELKKNDENEQARAKDTPEERPDSKQVSKPVTSLITGETTIKKTSQAKSVNISYQVTVFSVQTARSPANSGITTQNNHETLTEFVRRPSKLLTEHKNLLPQIKETVKPTEQRFTEKITLPSTKLVSIPTTTATKSPTKSSEYKQRTTMYKNILTTQEAEKPVEYKRIKNTYKNVLTTQEPENIHRMDYCPSIFVAWYGRENLYTKDNIDEVNTFISTKCLKTHLQECRGERKRGSLYVDQRQVDLNWLYINELSFVRRGGWFQPPDCSAQHHTAILIPFRNRERHLPVLLRHLHPILKRQQIHYHIFVIEQTDKDSFNRAKLFNVGYKEALKHFPYDCLVFHDVDLIPEDDRIEYSCRRSPSHLSVGVDTLGYRLPYKDIFGGVSSMSRKHFEQLNGFSNLFWTWGGEDDNLSKRLRDNGLVIHRQSISISRYTMLGHQEAPRAETDDRVRFLEDSYDYFDEDGLNSLQYDVIGRHYESLYTLIKINLNKNKDKTFGIQGV